MVLVAVDYLYDLHFISITETMWARVLTGRLVVIEGQGFPVEGGWERDRWAFNHGAVGAVHVMTDTGRDVFEGDLGDAEVDVRHEK